MGLSFCGVFFSMKHGEHVAANQPKFEETLAVNQEKGRILYNDLSNINWNSTSKHMDLTGKRGDGISSTIPK